MADSVLDKKQIKRTVSYLGKDGKRMSKEITLEELAYEDALAINDLAQSAGGYRDFGEIYSEIMEKVLVNPRWDYKTVKTLITNDGQDKGTITFNGRKDAKLTLDVVFPDARTAVNLMMNTQKADGSMNIKETVQALNESVFRDKNGKPLTWEYWSNHGGAYNALAKASDFLLKGFENVGFMATMSEAYSFLQEQL